MKLPDAVEDTRAKSLKNLYHFGDGWEHAIKIEKLSPTDPALSYLRVLDGLGCCPPEDVGVGRAMPSCSRSLPISSMKAMTRCRNRPAATPPPNTPVDIVDITLRLNKLAKRPRTIKCPAPFAGGLQ
jgi:hypothetical protein